jgi:hypothetical protein
METFLKRKGLKKKVSVQKGKDQQQNQLKKKRFPEEVIGKLPRKFRKILRHQAK